MTELCMILQELKFQFIVIGVVYLFEWFSIVEEFNLELWIMNGLNLGFKVSHLTLSHDGVSLQKNIRK
jgi:hypothetical protein